VRNREEEREEGKIGDCGGAKQTNKHKTKVCWLFGWVFFFHEERKRMIGLSGTRRRRTGGEGKKMWKGIIREHENKCILLEMQPSDVWILQDCNCQLSSAFVFKIPVSEVNCSKSIIVTTHTTEKEKRERKKRKKAKKRERRTITRDKKKITN